MAREPASTPVGVAATLSRMEEQIRTLQRERGEDRQEMREEVQELRDVFKAGVADLKQDIAHQLTPVKLLAESAQKTATENDKWIRTVKTQGATWAVALTGIGAAIWAMIELLWDRVTFR